ncbi:MAG: 16S rRNA (uracil(1498)-N(3))-methyltransferase [Lachnospiraceae bacterium]|nr:16S rRNA (uracil(1498)-N(3))-methyltransferase [Lachnospiraceae bacterium]MBQ5484771.1 16S rRNA (uracil(1498)-N(3))-methyltransferase [Lachnospiraceae bacterium]
MQQVFIDEGQLNKDEVILTGQDAKHLAKVIRIRVGEVIRVSVSSGRNYLATVSQVSNDMVVARITEEAGDTELSQKIYLFQALPKGSRMETIIEKCVELGVYEIIPVEMKYCVVKLDAKKKKNKVERYQAIAEAAAKQSKRSIIPRIHEVMSYQDALSYAAEMDLFLLPYENKSGMAPTKEAFARVKDATSVSIMIGPEGGFAEEEIALAGDKAELVSLGSRILRTDTAAITSVSAVMLAAEMQE